MWPVLVLCGLGSSDGATALPPVAVLVGGGRGLSAVGGGRRSSAARARRPSARARAAGPENVWRSSSGNAERIAFAPEKSPSWDLVERGGPHEDVRRLEREVREPRGVRRVERLGDRLA